MPQGQDLPVERVHAVERLLHPDLQLGPGGRTAGRGEPPQELGGQGGRRRLRQGAAVERDLPVGVPGLGAEVPAVDGDELLPGDVPQPEEERELGVAGVVGEVLADLQEGVLEHVGRVHPALEAAVEPKPDHGPQPVPVAGEQVVGRLLVAGGRPPQQVRDGAVVASHQKTPLPL